MPTLVLDPAPQELEALKERRRQARADRHDEVWEGVLHMVPAPSHEHARLVADLVYLLRPRVDDAGLEITADCNIGTSEDDFRVPDLALHRPGAGGAWHPTAALVIEIVSPGDETWAKLPFYARHGVDEVVIVDPQDHSVHWLGLSGDKYREVENSSLIDLGPAKLGEQIDWPT